MKFNLSSYLFGCCILLLGCTTFKNTASTKNVLLATDLKPFGRFDVKKQNKLELISSAVHFGFSFQGKECIIDASILNKNGHNYLQYELDGEYKRRIKIEGGSSQPIVIAAATDGKHRVWVYKATEAHTGPIFISKISANNIVALQQKSQPTIEFIGNSITCGAAADPSEVACGTGEYHDQHNAYYAYGPRVARRLNVNFILSSVSGIGIYRNWNSDRPIMPDVYEKTDFQENINRLWDFTTYSPKIVSIALGTNDLSRGDGIKKRLPFDSAVFVNNYVKFVVLVKKKYPASRIALLSSPMSNGNDRLLLQNCLAAVKRQIDELYPADKKVALHFFQPMKARGCTGHPSVEDHQILANELEPFFKKLL